jgi:hypothetical protein
MSSALGSERNYHDLALNVARIPYPNQRRYLILNHQKSVFEASDTSGANLSLVHDRPHR